MAPKVLAAALAGVLLLSLAPPAGAGQRVHVVRRGETLTSVARVYGVSVAALRRANGIRNPNLVLAGRKLVVPGRVLVSSWRSVRPVRVPAGRMHLRPLFEQHARRAGVRDSLAMALAWQESGWQPRKVSRAGAIGVMQLMPDTVDFVSHVLLGRRARLDPREPSQNIRMGTVFLRYLLDQNRGNTRLAVSSWFQGLASVRRSGPTPATRKFAANVAALEPRFR